MRVISRRGVVAGALAAPLILSARPAFAQAPEGQKLIELRVVVRR